MTGPNGDHISNGRVIKSRLKSIAQLRDGTAASWLQDLQTEQEQLQAHLKNLEEKASEHDQLQAQHRDLERKASKAEWQKKVLEVENAEMKKAINECATADQKWEESTYRKDLNKARNNIKQAAKKYPEGGDERRSTPNTQTASDPRLPLKGGS